jgi:hypothetical protein
LAPPNSARSVTLSSVPENRSSVSALPRSKREVGPGVEVEGQHAHPHARRHGGQELEPVAAGAAPDGQLARPRARMGGKEGPVRGLVLGELRQVEEGHLGPVEHQRARERRWARIARRQVVDGAVLADRLHPARLGIRDVDKPEVEAAPSCWSWITSAGSSASREGGRRKLAVSRPIQASISARRQRRSASSGGTAIGKASEAMRRPTR